VALVRLSDAMIAAALRSMRTTLVVGGIRGCSNFGACSVLGEHDGAHGCPGRRSLGGCRAYRTSTSHARGYSKAQTGLFDCLAEGLLR
jgi:hypothetical protein